MALFVECFFVDRSYSKKAWFLKGSGTTTRRYRSIISWCGSQRYAWTRLSLPGGTTPVLGLSKFYTTSDQAITARYHFVPNVAGGHAAKRASIPWRALLSITESRLDLEENHRAALIQLNARVNRSFWPESLTSPVETGR